MKISVRQFTSITCILCFVFLTTSPIYNVYANDYLTHVRIELIGIDHDDGTTNHVVSVSESYGTHHPIGSHFHPSPIVDVFQEYENCTDNNCSKCS